MVPLADLLTCRDDPKSLTQLAKNEVYSSGMICSLMIILHNQFCHPVSARQNDWTSGVVGKELCEPQTPATPDDAIFVYARVNRLSLINWLFCGIGLPKLKAAYSSRNASRCTKLTISSSASFISSGDNSMPAFLSSLLRRLCNTLLTLACTRTKRVQLENRFGSSLHTSQVLLRFGVASSVLKAIRHKGCGGIRAFFPL